MGPSRLLEISRSLFDLIMNSSLTTLVWSRWLDTGLVLCCIFIGEYTAILTERAWSITVYNGIVWYG